MSATWLWDSSAARLHSSWLSKVSAYKETLESVLVNLSLKFIKKKKSIALKGPESKYEVTASSWAQAIKYHTAAFWSWKQTLRMCATWFIKRVGFEEINTIKKTVPGGCLHRTELLSCQEMHSDVTGTCCEWSQTRRTTDVGCTYEADCKM